LPFYYVSASDGTNVVKVFMHDKFLKNLKITTHDLFFYGPQLFNDAISAAITYRINPTDLSDQIIDELEALQ
jgi:hypothetical protein